MEEQLVPQPLSQGVVSSRPSLSLVEGGKMRSWERGHVAAVVRSQANWFDTQTLKQC